MKPKTKNLIMILALAGVFLMTSSAYALEGPSKKDFGRKQEKHQGGKMHQKGKIMAEAMDELNLTKEQREEIKKNKEAYRESGQEIREGMRSKRKELKRELDKWESDDGKINNLVDEIAELQKETLQNRIEGILSVKKVLTEEQFEELKQKLEVKKEVAKALHKKNRGREEGDFRGPRH